MWGEKEAICGICRRRVTKRFVICEACQQEYGRHSSDREEWANFLVNEEAARRRRMYDVDRTRDGKEDYLEDVLMWESGFSYDIEEWIIIKEEFINVVIDDSDGAFELQDSDWLGAFSYSV